MPRRRVSSGPGAATAVRENLPRPAAPAPVAQGLTRPTPQQPVRRRNPFAFLGKLQPRFVADIVAELRKVTWPTLAETRYLTIVVAIVAILVGAILGSLDLLFGWIIEKLFF
jgi:preprotein translocase SecE subunit